MIEYGNSASIATKTEIKQANQPRRLILNFFLLINIPTQSICWLQYAYLVAMLAVRLLNSFTKLSLARW